MSLISTTVNTPASVDCAICFLTRPLINIHSSALISKLHLALRKSLSTCFELSIDSELVLRISNNYLPPRPLFAACLDAGLYWIEWMNLLGGCTFDLVIEAHAVKVFYEGVNPRVEIIWMECPPSPSRHVALVCIDHEEPEVPISKLGQQSAMRSPLLATRKARPARPFLVEQGKDKAEATLAMVSKCEITPPWPTSEPFRISPPTLIMPIATAALLSSPESVSPASSRSSSCSTAFSDISSGNESITSISTASSFVIPASAKPSFVTTATNTVNEQAPGPISVVPRKKDITKYLYQGGVSTVLTGGVMLGVPSKAAPKYRAPIGGKKFTTAQKATSADTWRRASRV